MAEVELLSLDRLDKIPDAFTAEFSNGDRFQVNVALIADYSLYTGRLLDEAAFEALKKAAGLYAAKKRALRILGRRQMSRREIIGRLVDKGESLEVAEQTADWLTQIGALNDNEYAASIVRHYAQRGYGEKRIRDELYRRGIDRELWEEALGALPEAEDGAYAYLVSKLKGRPLEEDDRKRLAEIKRLTDALCRRGFSWDNARDAVQRYMNTEDLYNDE
jgi:regulatory protein